ncbi:MAG TPA: LLM class flavin-dependent oxidoreductase [Actinomycetota bacterium]|nr:LLM class flavin-dependent oxidoreductase [Actinomycetota bacterium]
MAFKIGVGLFTAQLPEGTSRTFQQEYRETLELVQLVETHGLDSAWVSEHHGSADGYLPSLLPLLAAFAAVTTRIELGTGVVLAPFHDPLRLAEDFAVVDQLSGGRTICGLGVGWRDEEFRMFGLDVSSRVRRLTELTEILRKAWTGERFDHRGRFHTYEGVAVTPRPARTPPILIGGFVDDAIRRAGRIGDGYISSRAEPARVEQAFAMAAAARSEAGGEGPPVVAVLQNAFVTTDPDGDWPQVEAGIGHQLGVYAGWRTGKDVPGVPLEVMPPDTETIRRTTSFGTPDDVVTSLEPVVKALSAYPDSHLILRLHYPGMAMEPSARAIELLGREVAPRLRDLAART